MKLSHALTLALTTVCSIGCASRVAPFNKLDQAQITVLRLQGVEPPALSAPAGMPAIPGLSSLPPQLQQAAQGAAAMMGPLGQALAQAVPGLAVPGVAAPAAAQAPRFQNYVILSSLPVYDESLKGEILDLFGDEKTFEAGPPSCLTPGLGVAIVPVGGQPIEVLVSLNCHQVQPHGLASWPHKGTMLSAEGSQRMHKLYERVWGTAVPPSGN